jgi:hypothetical protein
MIAWLCYRVHQRSSPKVNTHVPFIDFVDGEGQEHAEQNRDDVES